MVLLPCEVSAHLNKNTYGKTVNFSGMPIKNDNTNDDNSIHRFKLFYTDFLLLIKC